MADEVVVYMQQRRGDAWGVCAAGITQDEAEKLVKERQASGDGFEYRIDKKS